MDAIVLIGLILALIAIAAQRIASAPLITTLGICFGNWAEESRSRDFRSG